MLKSYLIGDLLSDWDSAFVCAALAATGLTANILYALSLLTFLSYIPYEKLQVSPSHLYYLKTIHIYW